jgi:hypothetical protein
MPIFTDAEQHEVERLLVADRFGVLSGGFCGAEFGRNRVNLRGGDGDVIQPARLRHAGIACRVIGWQAAFVTPEDFPRRPLLRRRGEPLVNPAGRRAAGQHQTKDPGAGQSLPRPQR